MKGRPSSISSCIIHSKIVITSAEVGFGSLRPYQSGHKVRQNKTSRMLSKAVQIADQIVDKEITFKDATLLWTAKTARGSKRHSANSSSEGSSSDRSSVEANASLKNESPVKKTVAKTSKVKPSEVKKSTYRRTASKKRPAKGEDEKNQTHESAPQPTKTEKVNIESPIEQKTDKKIASKGTSKREEGAGQSKSRSNQASIMHEILTESLKNQRPSIKASDSNGRAKGKPKTIKAFDLAVVDQGQASKLSSKEVSQGVSAGMKETNQAIDESKTSRKATIAHFCESNRKQTSKNKSILQAMPVISLSILEDTPKERTPAKTGMCETPGLASLTKQRDTEPIVDDTAVLTLKDVVDEVQASNKKIKPNKSSANKPSSHKKGKRTDIHEGDNSSYDTEAMEQMYEQADKKQVNSNLDLADIIPLRDGKRSISTISDTYSYQSFGEPFAKKEFLFEESKESEPKQANIEANDPAILLSNEQRQRITDSDKQLEVCLKKFLEAQKQIKLQGKILAGFPTLSDIIDEFLVVYQKAEVHKLPPELLLSNNIGASLNSICQVVKSLSHLLPSEHAPILQLLDQCVSTLGKKLEDYVNSS